MRKVVVVTGGNRGIGFATAARVAACGHQLVLACRNEERGREASERIAQAVRDFPTSSSSAGGAPTVPPVWVPFDLLDEDAIVEGARRAKAQFTNIDVVVHGAVVSSESAARDLGLNAADMADELAVAGERSKWYARAVKPPLPSPRQRHNVRKSLTPAASLPAEMEAVGPPSSTAADVATRLMDANFTGTMHAVRNYAPLFRRRPKPPTGTFATRATKAATTAPALDSRFVILGSRMATGRAVRTAEVHEPLVSEAANTESVAVFADSFLTMYRAGHTAQTGFPVSPFLASKVATGALARALAREPDFVEDGIRVLSCCPGPSDTQSAAQDLGPDGALAAIAADPVAHLSAAGPAHPAPGAMKSPFDGADTPAWLALAPSVSAADAGKFFCERRPVDWAGTPARHSATMGALLYGRSAGGNELRSAAPSSRSLPRPLKAEPDREDVSRYPLPGVGFPVPPGVGMTDKKMGKSAMSVRDSRMPLLYSARDSPF